MNARNYCIIVLVTRLIGNIYSLKIEDNWAEWILPKKRFFGYYKE